MDDAYGHILSYCNVSDLITCRQVCKLFYDITNDTLFLKKIFPETKMKRTFWNSVFIHNISTKPSPFYCDKNDSIIEDAKKMWSKEVSEEQIEQITTYTTAIMKGDAEVIDSAYERLCPEIVEAFSNKAVSVDIMARSGDLQILVSYLRNHPRVLPLVELTEESVDEAMDSIATIYPDGYNLGNIIGPLFFKSRFDQVQLMMDCNPSVDHELLLRCSLCNLKAFKWVEERISNIDYSLTFDKVVDSCLEVAKYCISKVDISADVTGWSQKFFISALRKCDYEMLDWITDAKDIARRSLYSKVVKDYSLASLHLFMKYLQEGTIREDVRSLAHVEFVSFMKRTDENDFTYMYLLRECIQSGDPLKVEYMMEYCMRHITIDWDKVHEFRPGNRSCYLCLQKYASLYDPRYKERYSYEFQLS